MKTFNVRLAETFLWDMKKSVNTDIPRKFREDVLAAIEERSFGADSYESYYPYDGSPEYRRIYFGNYTIYYVIDGDYMDVRRILWSGADDSDNF